MEVNPSAEELNFERRAAVEDRIAALETVTLLLMQILAQSETPARLVIAALRRHVEAERKANAGAVYLRLLTLRADYLERLVSPQRGEPSP